MPQLLRKLFSGHFSIFKQAQVHVEGILTSGKAAAFRCLPLRTLVDFCLTFKAPVNPLRACKE